MKSGKLRILTFTTLYPSSAQPQHGIFVENRLRHLVQTDRVSSMVVAPVPWFPSTARLFGRYAIQASVPRQEIRHGIPVSHPRYLVLPKISMAIAPAMLFTSTISLIRRLHAEVQFQLIDAHYFYPDGVAAVWLGATLGIPVIITARGTDVNLIPRYPLPRRLIQSAARGSAGIVAVSRALKEAMVSLGIAADQITVLRNGVDLEDFTPDGREDARASLGLNGKTLLSVGHLIERKGHHIAISALRLLRDCTLIIAGEGPERAHLLTLAASLGVSDRVRFVGAVPHPDLQRFYSAADALVLASSREGWPNVLLEAMACGAPVVATAIWGNPEVVASPEAGVLMRSRTPEALAEAVDALFRNAPSRAATRAYAEQFSWHDTSFGQIQLFEKAIATHKQT